MFARCHDQIVLLKSALLGLDWVNKIDLRIVSTRRLLCINCHFLENMQVWDASPGETSIHFYQQPNRCDGENCSGQIIAKIRCEVVPAAWRLFLGCRNSSTEVHISNKKVDLYPRTTTTKASQNKEKYNEENAFLHE